MQTNKETPEGLIDERVSNVYNPRAEDVENTCHVNGGRTSEGMPKQYQFCRVCRQNHDHGKGHRYAAKHKQRLDPLLKKVQKKIEEVRFFLKNVMRLRAHAGERSKFWCYFCEQEIREEASVFACAETIVHLASKKHVDAVKTFWFENGCDVDKRQLFFISDTDLEKWEEACKVAPPLDVPELQSNEVNNIHLERCRTDAGSAENVNESSVAFGSSLAVKPLSVLTDRSFQRVLLSSGKSATNSQLLEVDQANKTPTISGAPLSDGTRVMQITGQVDWQFPAATRKGAMIFPSNPSGVQHQSTGGFSITHGQVQTALGENLTAIRPRSLNPGEGNVHSGALPPWLKSNSSQGSGSLTNAAQSAGRSMPLSKTQEKKLAKLRNPHRVGAAWAEKRRAEIEREQRGEVVEKSVPDTSSWMPNFGRVWQSGSRRETRKEFEAEKRSELKTRLRGQTERMENASSKSFTPRPYVSKRQRIMEDTEAKVE